MPFNENQIFYASLWWLAGLPGGPEHVPSVLARYNKEPVEFPPYEVKRGRKEANPFEMTYDELTEIWDQETRGYFPANEPIAPETLDVFFDHLYAIMLKVEKLHYNATGSERYIELRHSFATSSDDPAYPDYPFSDELEEAIAVAGINRHALPQKMAMFAHSDGQLFVPTGQGKRYTMVPFVYPGQPALPYQHIDLLSKDLDGCQTLTWETLYRVVPLQEGQVYKTGYIAVNGERVEYDRVARKDEVLLIGNNDVDNTEHLWTLTDEEIINFHPALRGSFSSDREEFEPGYHHEHYGTHIEATERPNIVSHLKPGVSFMVIKEPIQIGYGSSFGTAEAGDFIIREGEGYTPRVMAKRHIDSGRVRFVFPNSEGGQPPTPQFN